MGPEVRTLSRPKSLLSCSTATSPRTTPVLSRSGLYVHNKVILIDGTYQGVRRSEDRLRHLAEPHHDQPAGKQRGHASYPEFHRFIRPTWTTSLTSGTTPCESARLLPRQPPVSTAPVKRATVRRQATTALTLTSSQPFVATRHRGSSRRWRVAALSSGQAGSAGGR